MHRLHTSWWSDPITYIFSPYLFPSKGESNEKNHYICGLSLDRNLSKTQKKQIYSLISTVKTTAFIQNKNNADVRNPNFPAPWTHLSDRLTSRYVWRWYPCSWSPVSNVWSTRPFHQRRIEIENWCQTCGRKRKLWQHRKRFGAFVQLVRAIHIIYPVVLVVGPYCWLFSWRSTKVVFLSPYFFLADMTKLSEGAIEVR